MKPGRRVAASSVAVALALCLAGSNAQVAIASPLGYDKKLQVVLMGDSYSAGNGACADGEYAADAPGAYQCNVRNWAALYANWLNGQGVHTTWYHAEPTDAVRVFQC